MATSSLTYRVLVMSSRAPISGSKPGAPRKALAARSWHSSQRARRWRTPRRATRRSSVPLTKPFHSSAVRCRPLRPAILAFPPQVCAVTTEKGARHARREPARNHHASRYDTTVLAGGLAPSRPDSGGVGWSHHAAVSDAIAIAPQLV